MGYVPHTDKNVKDMLGVIGVSSIDDLFSDIPEEVRLREALNLPDALSEMELDAHIREIAALNEHCLSFIGAGSYRHYIPAAVDQLASRSEFYTAYTPYQPEVSQGTLSAIFEYQSMICRLTGMDAANASLYDGATALAESVLLAARSTGRRTSVVCGAVNPLYRDVLKTYAWANGIEIVTIPSVNGLSDADSLCAAIDDATAAVIVQNPNFFGSVMDVKTIAEAAHGRGSLLIHVVTEPLSLALLKKPSDCGADIVCGEAAGFGNPVGFGGPCLGLLSVKDEFLRKMPGRLAGKTVDADGKESYVLTLQTREQHIRRERATSNICSNEAHCALRAVIYLALAGKRLRDLAALNHSLASYLKDGLVKKGIEPLFRAPFFNEFAVRLPSAKKTMNRLKREGILFGADLGRWYPEYGNSVLLACTECVTPAQIDRCLELL